MFQGFFSSFKTASNFRLSIKIYISIIVKSTPLPLFNIQVSYNAHVNLIFML